MPFKRAAPAENWLMLQLRRELKAIIEWEAEDFECVTQTEIDAIAHHIIRMAELLRRTRVGESFRRWRTDSATDEQAESGIATELPG